MLHTPLADSANNFWWTGEFEDVENPDFENIKHLQNSGHLLLNAPSLCRQYQRSLHALEIQRVFACECSMI